MKWLRWVVAFRFLGLLIFAFVLWQAYVFFAPRPRTYSETELKAIDRALCQAVDRLAPSLRKGARVGVAHVIHDANDQATTALKVAMTSRTGAVIPEDSLIQQFLSNIAETVAAATSLDEVVFAARRVELDVVVGARVVAVGPLDNYGATATLDVYAYDLNTSAWLMREPVTAQWQPPALVRMTDSIRRTSPLSRFAVWLGCVALLPWATAFMVRRALEHKTNRAALALLGVYTLIGMTLAAFLTGFSIIGGNQWFTLLGALVLCTGYNYWACEVIAGREKA